MFDLCEDVLSELRDVFTLDPAAPEGTTCSERLIDRCVFSLPLSPTDAFVNSQEWTLSRSVPELKVVSGKDLNQK